MKNKLILTDNLIKYNNMATYYKRINQEIPQSILFKIFSEAGILDSLIKVALSANNISLF
jgi:hypothetical protein